jgi:hypothetical protein
VPRVCIRVVFLSVCVSCVFVCELCWVLIEWDCIVYYFFVDVFVLLVVCVVCVVCVEVVLFVLKLCVMFMCVCCCC